MVEENKKRKTRQFVIKKKKKQWSHSQCLMIHQDEAKSHHIIITFLSDYFPPYDSRKGKHLRHRHGKKTTDMDLKFDYKH